MKSVADAVTVYRDRGAGTVRAFSIVRATSSAVPASLPVMPRSEASFVNRATSACNAR